MVGLHTVTNGPLGLPIPVGAIIRPLTYAYDAAGNLSAASDGRSYAYDPAGKMVRDQKAGVASAHLYNWEGRRTASVTGAASVAYIHDGRSLLVEYLNGSVSRSYHYGERLTAIEAGAAKYGLHLDPLGSVVEVTGDAGPDCARTYDPWGEFAENGPCAADPKLAYTGHEYDQTSGLYNFGARYYDPATARFTTLDPYFGDTSAPPSLHKYLYAYANPYRWVDLEGYAAYGIGIGAELALILGGDGSISFVWDDTNQFGIAIELGASGGPQVAYSPRGGEIFYSPEAKSIDDLSGFTVGFKARAGVGLSVDFPVSDVEKSFAYAKELDKALSEGRDYESVQKPNYSGPAVYGGDIGYQLGIGGTVKGTAVLNIGNFTPIVRAMEFLVCIFEECGNE